MLIGLGVGVLAPMVITLTQQRRYRTLFSDTHLEALVEALGPARSAPATTFGGVTVSWRELPLHSALVLDVQQKVAPEAMRFLMGVALSALGREPTAALLLGAKRYALVMPGAIPSVIKSDPSTWRTAGVAAMRDLPIVPGALDAYR